MTRGRAIRARAARAANWRSRRFTKSKSPVIPRWARAKEFARRLVSGVVSQRADIDRTIEQSTENWKLERLAKVDLVILRMATYELIFCPDIPTTVSLDEAIEIGKRFGSADSGTFINGVLDQIAQSAKSAF
jgi:transcription antitermination factor NusB